MQGSGAVTRVVIIDDHVSFADSLAMALNAEADIECVGTAESVQSGIKLTVEGHPDVVLMDAYLPTTDGIEGTKQLLEVAPDTHVIMLTGHADVELLAEAASVGAAGFLPKEASFVEVAQAIRDVRDGHMLVPPEMLRHLLQARAGRTDPGRRNRVVELTPREQEVLALLAEATDLATIASVLSMSIHTCRGHVKNLLMKLGAHSQLEGVLTAARLGLIVLPTSEVD